MINSYNFNKIIILWISYVDLQRIKIDFDIKNYIIFSLHVCYSIFFVQFLLKN